MFYQSVKGKHTGFKIFLHDPKISFQVDNQTFNGYGRVFENVEESDLIH
jgi:hypothetical protein